jgi:hypothetical protein
MNVIYIQSGEDYMLNKKHYDRIKLRDHNNRMIYLEKGFHILSMEEPLNNELYNIIKQRIL